MFSWNPDQAISHLHTLRLTLEPLTTAHAAEMFKVLSDPAIYEFENEPPVSLDWLHKNYRRLEKRRSPDGQQRWLNWVIRYEPAGLIGFVQATVTNDRNGEALIAFVLASPFWGQGFAREASEAMLSDLVYRQRVRFLYAVLKRANNRSRILLERLGFTDSTTSNPSSFEIGTDELFMIRETQNSDQTMTRTAAIRWKGVAIGLLVLLVGLIVWDGSDRRAADATRPLLQGNVSPSPAIPPRTLKLASFNIHGGKGTDGIRDLSRISQLLSAADFAGLYEVRGGTLTSETTQAEELGALCRTSWTFAPTEHRWWSDHFGNALLSRIPVKSVLRIPLVNTRGKAYRNAILATVAVEGTDVQILAVHIDRENDRRAQLQTVIDLFLGLRAPCILMGDLNTTATDPILTGLSERHEVHSPLQHSLSDRLPSQNIDWIFTRGLKTLSIELIENSASDHPLITAEFEPAASN